MKSTLLLAAAVSGVVALSACDVKKTQEGNVTLPKVEKTQLDLSMFLTRDLF